MFDSCHYVPVLRWKRGERWALRQVATQDRKWITPLVEMVPSDFDLGRRRRPVSTHRVLVTAVDDLESAWGSRPIFLDLHLLSAELRSNNLTMWGAITKQLQSRELHIIPVCSLDPESSADAVQAVRTLGTGAALRVSAHELLRADLNARVRSILGRLAVVPEQVDVVVDVGVTGELALPAAELCARIQHLRNWRTLTLLAGAFPPDLTGLTPGVRVLPRHDWTAWCDLRTAGDLDRLPAYGDYTVQHAKYREPPLGANFSASIRYSADKHWIVMRGEGVRNQGGGGYDQWPANAMLLVDRPEYLGPDFSAGDAYISERARAPERTGNAETWIRAGINHHLTLAARQLASLLAA